MKKVMLVAMLSAALLTLSGCSTDKFPRVSIQRTHWKMDNTKLPLPNGYNFNELHLYEIILDDDQPHVRINLVKE